MKKSSLHHSLALLSLPLLLAACSQGPVGGSPSATAPKPAPQRPLLSTSDVSTSSTRWILQLKADPTESSAETVKREQDAFRAAAAAAKIEYQELHTYSKLLNGFTIKATESEIRRLRNLPGVTQVSPVTYFTAPVLDKNTKNEDQNIAEMFYARGMTGVTQAAKELGLTGKGVKVGVIDTGIEKDHPAFKGRIVSAVDIVGDAFTGEPDEPFRPDPMYPFPEDCAGHGTHVAGIVGGSDPQETRDRDLAFSGVAPGVQFGIYRVFGCKGGSSDEAIIQALEQAYIDKMQVVNLSIGHPFHNWTQSPDAVAANRLVKKGVVVVASAGNSGRNGPYSMGGVTMGENVISVASVANTKIDKGTFFFNEDPNNRIAFDVAEDSPPVVKGMTFDLIQPNKSQLDATVKETYGDDDNKYGCFAYTKDALKGKAVLISRGKPENMGQNECSFFDKVRNAEKGGAKAVVLYNNKPGPLRNIDLHKTGGFISIPVMPISGTDSQQLLKLLATNKSVNIAVDGVRKGADNLNSSNMSSFSSYGMSAELEFKPDIAAPGGSIFSSVPHHLGDETGYAVYSGTSMASPHVAGIVALLLEADPTLKAKDVRTLLMNTASLRPYSEYNRESEAYEVSSGTDFVERQGAGLIDIMNAYKALKQTPVSVYPPKLSLKDSARHPVAHKVLTLRNDSNQALEYTIKHVPALTIKGTEYEEDAGNGNFDRDNKGNFKNSYYAVEPLTVYASMKINGKAVDSDVLKVTVPAGGETELNLEITPPADVPELSQYGGYVQLTSVSGPNLSVPYGGLTGDYLKKPIFGTMYSDGYSRQTPIFFDRQARKEVDRDETVKQVYGKNSIPDFTFQKTVAEGANPRTAKAFDDVPRIRINFAHQARRLTMELIELNDKQIETGKRTLDVANYVRRNCTYDLGSHTRTCPAYNEIEWDGKIPDAAVPEGKDAPAGLYQLRITVLKPTGEAGVGGNEEVYDSPVFKVVRKDGSSSSN